MNESFVTIELKVNELEISLIIPALNEGGEPWASASHKLMLR